MNTHTSAHEGDDSSTISLSESIALEPPDALIPDMRVVLKKFNIDPDNLKEVNIESYHWSQVDVEEPPEPTISQRIRTLVRGTRYRSNVQ